MKVSKLGDRVQVHYRGTLEDQSEFDSSFGKDPLEFTLGEKMVIEGFENGIIGMEEGEKRTVVLEPAQGYGEYSTDHWIEVDRTDIDANIEIQTGMMLPVQAENGQVFKLPVRAVNEKVVTLDTNHPLAGKELTFEIELVKILR